MAYKMGKNKGLQVSQGEIRDKLKFKKDRGKGSSTTIVIKKSLGEGIQGEANNDGTIFISDQIPDGSPLEKKVIKHEAKHMMDMRTGKLGYDDDSITWNGKKYERKNGKVNYRGKWLPEGSKDLPWEKH